VDGTGSKTARVRVKPDTTGLATTSRRRLTALALGCALVVLAPRTAAAEWQFTPMLGWTFAGNTNIVFDDAIRRTHRSYGGAVSLLGGGLFGVEALTTYTPGFFQPDSLGLVTSSRTLSLMGNAVLTVPRQWTEYSLRPFVSGGFGLMYASSTDTSVFFPVRTSLGGFNVGGGAIGFLSKRTGVRFDLRYSSSLHRTEQQSISFGRTHLSYMTASIGLVLRR
jgi:hypothetical protein